RPDGRTKQRQASRAQILRLVDPRDTESFERFYRSRRMILKAPEDDDAVTGRLDLVTEQPEAATEPEAIDLAFDQPLGGMLQRALRLADAHGERAAFGLTGLDQQFTEEVRFSRAPAPVNRLIPRGAQERLENPSGLDFQGRQ